MPFPLPESLFPPESEATPGLRLVVAPLGRRHLAEVTAIEQVSFPQPWERRLFEAILVSKRYLGLAALTLPAQVVAGYACFWFTGEGVQIQNVAVHPSFRRRGVARNLLKLGFKEALARGAELATLEVRPSNLAARRLYASLGFREMGRLPKYYQAENEDALILQRRLG